MLEENTHEEEIFSEDNYTKPIANQIDDIISKYRTQLEKLKTNTNQDNKDNSIESFPIITSATLKSKTLSTLIDLPEIKDENVQKNEPKKYSSDLTKEIQNDNIKLQAALTAEKLNTIKLNTQLEKYTLELNKAKQEITELKNKLKNKENEVMNQINDINNDINKIKDENNLNINIIQRFFELFNKNIDLFNKSKIITIDRKTRLVYLEDDREGNNQKISIFAVNSLDILINKLLKDNKELYNQLIETKTILDEQNNTPRETFTIKEIKKDYLILKEQLQNMIRENELIKNENIKLKNHLVELNNYINNNNNFNINNQINRFNDYERNNYFNNYNTRQRNNSYNNFNRNKKYNYSEINKEINLNNYKDNNNNISSRNIRTNLTFQNPMNNNSFDNNSNNNYTNNNYNNIDNYKINYYKTDENVKVNNNDIGNENNNNDYIYNYNFNYNNVKENQKVDDTVYERPIDQLKKKIKLFEQQMKNSSD